MSRSVLQGTGYNPSLGPQSTDPKDQQLQSLSSLPSPLPSPGTIKKQINVTNLIYEKNLYRTKHEISLSSISYLFMQIIQFNLKNSKSLLNVERKLNNLGYSIGLKYLELTKLRENFENNISSSIPKSNVSVRYTKILKILNFIISKIWLNLFDKPADSLEKSSEFDNQYMIIDNNPILTKFISTPNDYKSLNCEAFIAGLIEGILDSAYFNCEVSAHNVPQDGFQNRTVYLIKFENSVILRDAITED